MNDGKNINMSGKLAIMEAVAESSANIMRKLGGAVGIRYSSFLFFIYLLFMFSWGP